MGFGPDAIVGAIERLREPEHRYGAVTGEIEVIGDDGAEPPRRLRVMRGRSNAMSRVPSANASLRSWVTITMVMLCSRQSGRMSACICARVPGSSAPNGSSSSSTRGSRASACAIASRCCMPPDSALGYLSRCGDQPDRRQQGSLFAMASRRAAPRRRASTGLSANSYATSTLPSTVRCGNTE